MSGDIKSDLRRGAIRIWQKHLMEMGQKVPERAPYYQMCAEADMVCRERAGRAAADVYRAIATLLQDSGVHKPHSSELSKYPERAAALQKHEYAHGDYDAFFFTPEIARRYGLKTANIYRALRKLVETGFLEIVWQYDPDKPLKRKDGSSVNKRLGGRSPRTIYALSENWTRAEIDKINKTIMQSDTPMA